MIHLDAPFTEDKVRRLKVGDMVLISGKLYTGRDAVHKYLHEGGEPPVDFENQIIYHCGPVVLKQGSKWRITAAGPTTSSREEPYQAEIIQKFKIRGVIGKGGMGEKTLKACKDFGCVYLHAIGGAAQVLAEKIVSVDGVHMLEKFGSPEAIWEMTVKEFPVVVTIDSHGKSLHADVLKESKTRFNSLIEMGGKRKKVMAILKVARMGHPILRKKAKEVPLSEIKTAEFQRFLDDMVETMHEYEGIGLAAPQVHRSVRVSVIELPEAGSVRYPDERAIGLHFFINPKLTVLSKEKGRYWEGCLSVPGMRGLVERPQKVKVQYINREGEEREILAEGFMATVVQHEFDHLDGVLYTDKLVDSERFVFEQEYERYWATDADGEESLD